MDPFTVARTHALQILAEPPLENGVCEEHRALAHVIVDLDKVHAELLGRHTTLLSELDGLRAKLGFALERAKPRAA